MAQTKEGAAKTAAKYYNLSLEEYLERLKTEKACKTCKQWKLRSEFGKDRSSNDGLTKKCFDCKRVKVKKCWKGRVSTFKGKKHTEEAKKKISEAGKGIARRPKGWRHTEEAKKKISEVLRVRGAKGSKCHSWKGGITPENKKIRGSTEYIEWRQKVYERDSYTCQHCGDKKGGNLHAHHKQSFADHPELRFDVDNGETLCDVCHAKVHDKPFSIRKKRKVRKQTIGIVGFYKLSEAGRKWWENRQNAIFILKEKKQGNPIVKCACGCQQEFLYYDTSGRSRIFVSGHNFQSSPTVDAIIKLLLEKPMLVKEIVEATGRSPQAIRVATSKMKKRGLLEKVKEAQNG